MKTNKKIHPDLKRNIQHMVRLNRIEENQLREQLVASNGMKASKFIRIMITNGHVQAHVPIETRTWSLKFYQLLLAYRTNFNRISSLVKGPAPELHKEISQTVVGIQEILNKL